MVYRAQAPVILVAAVLALVPMSPQWVERVYSRSIYLSFQPYVTSASNLLPVALLDLAVAVLLAAFIVGIVRDYRDRGGRRAVVRGAVWLATVVAAVYILFLVTWGFNYRRVPLEAKLDFDRSRITQSQAIALASRATGQLNGEYADAHRDRFRADLLERSFADAQVLLGGTRLATTGRPKHSLAGLYFRYAAIDGMTVPVFLEVILNPDLLPVERPSVLAHEWAHLAGYSDESEANFVAWIAAVRSADPVARYSAWMDAYSLAANALPRRARASLPPLDEGPRQDLREIAARYARSSPLVRSAARGIYDSYLKANRVEEGIANYGVVLQLLLGTRFDETWKPGLAASELLERSGGGRTDAKQGDSGHND